MSFLNAKSNRTATSIMVDAQDTISAKPNEPFPLASKAIREAASAGDFNKVRQLVRDGADLNVFDQYGDSLLEEIVCDLLNEADKSFQASEMVSLLIELGADPNLMQPDGSPALVPAMLHMDLPMLKVLLEHGANPNPKGGVCDGSNLYDWADTDYQLKVWTTPGEKSPLAQRTDADLATEDAWLAFLDRMAIQYGVRRPDHLVLLRQYGARSKEELKACSTAPQDVHRQDAAVSPTPPQTDHLQAAKDFLTLVIRGGIDAHDTELAPRLIAMHEVHNGDPEFMLLFEEAANVYSSQVVAMTEAAFKSLGMEEPESEPFSGE